MSILDDNPQDLVFDDQRFSLTIKGYTVEVLASNNGHAEIFFLSDFPDYPDIEDENETNQHAAKMVRTFDEDIREAIEEETGWTCKKLKWSI
jgi:hypothetical protein